jgi:cellulose biosynthesis protein BcsQ
MKKHFESFGKPAYRILKSTSERALQDAESFLAKHSNEKFDYVIFDLPGRADDTALVGLTVDMDYVISPIEPDPQSLVACMTYALAVRDLGVSLTSSKIRQIYMLWNKIDKRVNPAVIEFYDQEIARQELGILDSRLPRSSRFKKELTPDNRDVFRSTYLPPDKKLLAGSNIEELAEEIIRKLTL